ncbi:MAG TPA: PEGA domain-containing protein, partial [Caldithrix sp.]|nr:PEGA domain-containing protein [Caldithrix sp.]
MSVKYFVVFVGVFFLFIFSCTTKDGKIINPVTPRGNLWVSTANFDSARIFLDYQDTGKKTPALLEDIPEGNHVVHVFLETTHPTPDSILVDIRGNQTDTARFSLTGAPNGDLTVETDPDSARVFLNKLDFGFTPLTILGLPERDYQLKILKGSYDPIVKNIQIAANDSLQLHYQLREDLHRIVLLEHFSNVFCVPCVKADEIVDSLTLSYDPVSLVIIGYHAANPVRNDPMYIAAQANVDLRWNLYGASFTPVAYVDGQTVSNPREEQPYRDLIDTRLAADSVATVGFQQLNRTDLLISGQLEVKAQKDLPAGTLLQIALIEDEIYYQTP